MAIQQVQIKGSDDSGSIIARVDSNNQLLTTAAMPPSFPANGGYYTVAGQTSAVVAATLAANTSLISMRMAPNATKKAFITKFRMLISVATVGAAATIPGSIGLQRFNVATPTGGTARNLNRLSETLGSGSDMTDIRDNNAALTVTNVAFGTVIASSIVPLFVQGGALWYEWVFEPIVPIVLLAGEGLVLRTQVAMPATQTWTYSYTFHWYEKV